MSYVHFSPNGIDPRFKVRVLPCSYTLNSCDVVLNGNKKCCAKDVKLNDTITFTYDGKEVSFQVLYIEISNYPPGCFSGDLKIKTSSNDFKLVKEIVPGEEIHSFDSSKNEYTISKVDKIVVTNCSTGNGFELYVSPSRELKITGYHPVMNDKYQWIYPVKHPSLFPYTEKCEKVYSFVMNGKTHPIIDGKVVIGLAHGIENDPVASHPFFGTDKVTKALEPFCNKGVCILSSDMFTRDPNTGLVNGILPKSDLVN